MGRFLFADPVHAVDVCFPVFAHVELVRDAFVYEDGFDEEGVMHVVPVLV